MIALSAPTERVSVLALTLDNSGTDLQAALDVLTDDLTAAVPSYLGLTMTLHQVGGPITLTAINRDIALAAGASLEIPLDAILGSGCDGTVVCYAGQSGSFVTLAAGTGQGCRVDGQLGSRGLAREGSLGAARQDEVIGESRPRRALPTAADPVELTDPAWLAGTSGLGDLTVVNRAIGVLISRGASPAEAYAELLHRTAGGTLSLPDVARRVLRSTNAPQSGPGSAPMPTWVTQP